MNAIDLKISKLLDIARQVYPQEACGFLLQNGDIYQCANLALEPESQALVSAEDYVAADRLGILALYHSHIRAEDARFSPADARAAKYHNLPIVMINAITGTYQVADPTGALNLPYEERDWLYGIHDCYALCASYLRRELGVILPEWERGDEGEWADPNFNPFVENHEAQGFERLSKDVDLQHGDLLLMTDRTHNPSHLGVVCDVDNGYFYHHLAGQKSRKDIWGGYWRKHCYGILRKCDNE